MYEFTWFSPGPSRCYCGHVFIFDSCVFDISSSLNLARILNSQVHTILYGTSWPTLGPGLGSRVFPTDTLVVLQSLYPHPIPPGPTKYSESPPSIFRAKRDVRRVVVETHARALSIDLEREGHPYAKKITTCRQQSTQTAPEVINFVKKQRPQQYEKHTLSWPQRRDMSIRNKII